MCATELPEVDAAVDDDATDAEEVAEVEAFHGVDEKKAVCDEDPDGLDLEGRIYVEQAVTSEPVLGA